MGDWDLFLLTMIGAALGLTGSAFAKAKQVEKRLARLEQHGESATNT